MIKFDPEAEVLNNTIKATHPVIYRLLSEKGKKAYYPLKGTLQQSSDAKGKDINATIGMALEDDKTPMRLHTISDAVSLDPNAVFPYAPSFGLPKLRNIWQNLIKEKNPSCKGKITLPVVTSGITQGLSVAGYLFLDPGDELILPELYWGNYRLIFEHAYDTRLLNYNTFKGDDFDTEAFKTVLSNKQGKLNLLLNFPNNPTGYSPTYAIMEEIVATILESAEKGNEIVVFTDDAYFGLNYREGIFKESIFSKLADLHENILAVKIDGATKEDFTWGLRVGFITYASKGLNEDACRVLEHKTAGRVRGNISSASHLSQSLILQALSSSDYKEEKNKKFSILKGRFDRFRSVLAENEEKYSPFFTPMPNNSGYFMCIKLIDTIDPEDIRQILLKKYSTGILVTKNLLRIAFSSVAENNIPILFENIYEACRDYNRGIGLD